MNSLAVQSDGKILVGGVFTSYNGTARRRIARLNNDGSLDTSFTVGTGFNQSVNSLAVQSDGKILVGGGFTSYNGTNRNYIVRLNGNGTLDSGFTVGTGLNSSVNSIAVQSDGKILVGGYFSTYNGSGSNCIARLNSDGTLDSGFTVGTGFGGSIPNMVNTIVVQSNGKILVGGSFGYYNGTNIGDYIARLNNDGTLDGGFTAGSVGTEFNGSVSNIIVQSDGKILVGGDFTSYNGVSRNYITRLNSGGTLDTSFDFDTSGPVSSIALGN